MKITVAQRRALLYLVHRKPGEWVKGTPVNQRCLNTLSKKGLVEVCFDGRVWLERITDAGREAVEHLRALDATPVCVGVGYCEVHKVWHMGVPAEPRK